ncbi:MAG: hypothetical protein ACW98I_04885 [Candidatus Hodarchaeales archaeon]|jgi:hypothetical protein
MYFTCSANIENGKINETLDALAVAEKRFTPEIGVKKEPRFF